MDTNNVKIPKVSGKKILYIGTLLLVVTSVILATLLIQNRPPQNLDNQSQTIIASVDDATIEELIEVSLDGYVGQEEKAALTRYLEEPEKLDDPVMLVDNLLYSAYMKGDSLRSSTTLSISDEQLKEYDAYLDALTNVSNPEDASQAISNYITFAKKLGFTPEMQ